MSHQAISKVNNQQNENDIKTQVVGNKFLKKFVDSVQSKSSQLVESEKKIEGVAPQDIGIKKGTEAKQQTENDRQEIREQGDGENRISYITNKSKEESFQARKSIMTQKSPRYFDSNSLQQSSYLSQKSNQLPCQMKAEEIQMRYQRRKYGSMAFIEDLKDNIQFQNIIKETQTIQNKFVFRKPKIRQNLELLQNMEEIKINHREKMKLNQYIYDNVTPIDRKIDINLSKQILKKLGVERDTNSCFVDQNQLQKDRIYFNMFAHHHQERALNICLLRDFLYQDRKEKIDQITQQLYPEKERKSAAEREQIIQAIKQKNQEIMERDGMTRGSATSKEQIYTTPSQKNLSRSFMNTAADSRRTERSMSAEGGSHAKKNIIASGLPGSNILKKRISNFRSAEKPQGFGNLRFDMNNYHQIRLEQDHEDQKLMGDEQIYVNIKNIKEKLKKISFAQKYKKIELVQSFVENDARFIQQQNENIIDYLIEFDVEKNQIAGVDFKSAMDFILYRTFFQCSNHFQADVDRRYREIQREAFIQFTNLICQGLVNPQDSSIIFDKLVHYKDIKVLNYYDFLDALRKFSIIYYHSQTVAEKTIQKFDHAQNLNEPIIEQERSKTLDLKLEEVKVVSQLTHSDSKTASKDQEIGEDSKDRSKGGRGTGRGGRKGRDRDSRDQDQDHRSILEVFICQRLEPNLCEILHIYEREIIVYKNNPLILNEMKFFENNLEQVFEFAGNHRASQKIDKHLIYLKFDMVFEIIWRLNIFPSLISKSELRYLYFYSNTNHQGHDFQDFCLFMHMLGLTIMRKHHSIENAIAQYKLSEFQIQNSIKTLFKEKIPGLYFFLYPLALFYMHESMLGLENTYLKLKSIKEEMEQQNVI